MKFAVVVFSLLAGAFALPAQNGMARIVGGNKATAGQFPATASLQYKSGGIVFSHVCEAVIVSPSWSLTAAQCRDSFDLSRYRIVAGLLNQGENNPGTQITSIEEFILHPDYHGGKSTNDIAVILHTLPLKWTDTVSPAKLPSSAPSGNAVVSSWGWGKPLEWTNVVILSNEDCAAELNSQGPFDNTQTCTNGDAAICGDDLGAPLEQDGTVVGVYSWSPAACGTEAVPAAYTKIDSHLDFIREYVHDLVH